MWQRIQTLFLCVAIITNLVLHLVNFALVKSNQLTYEFSLWGLLNTETGEMIYSSYPLLGLNMVSTLLSLVIIFMFQKRQLQIKLAKLNLSIQAAFVAAIFFLLDFALEDIGLQNAEVEYAIATLISVLPLLFIYLAIRNIKKDEALVRAADRIR